MTQYGTLRAWAFIATLVGVFGMIAAAIGSIVWAFEVEGFWQTIGVPGVLDVFATYSPIPLDAMPPLGRVLDGRLDWLLDAPSHDPSLQRGPDDPAERDADATGLQAIATAVSLTPTFRRFIEDPEPRRHIRSATA